MLQALDYKHSLLGNVTYIYGACTSDRFRKLGLMSQLLDFSFKEDIKNNKAASILIPANLSLFDFYKKFGYIPAFFTDEIIEDKIFPNFMNKNNLTYLSIKKADLSSCEAMSKIYENALKDCPHILRSPEYFKTQINMFNSLGGDVYILENNETQLGFCFINNEKIPFVQEILTIDNNSYLSEFKSLIFNSYAKDKIKFSTFGTKKPIGMIKYHSSEQNYFKSYMNLMYN